MFKFSDKILRTPTLTSLLGLFVNFEYISQIFPVFQLLTLKKWTFIGTEVYEQLSITLSTYYRWLLANKKLKIWSLAPLEYYKIRKMYASTKPLSTQLNVWSFCSSSKDITLQFLFFLQFFTLYLEINLWNWVK